MRNVLVRSLVTFAAAALAVACTATGSPGTLPPGDNGVTTIVWLADPTAQTSTDDVRQVLRDAFEQEHPSIRIELETGPPNTDSLRTLLISQLSADSPTPDVYDGDVVWPYYLAANGYALPLSKYIHGSFWNTFGPRGAAGSGGSALAAMTYHGQIYGVPEFIDEGFLFYRKDLLAKAHLPVPRTWEQLVADADALRAKHLPYQFVWQGNNYEGLTCVWYEFLADAYGGLPPGASPATELASPAARRALGFLRDLIADGISPQSVTTDEEPDADNAFDNGDAAFLRGWESSYSSALGPSSTLQSDDVGVELPPGFAGQPGTGWSTLGGWGLFVNPHTRHLAAALTFVQWLAGQQAQYILATQYSEIPANASVRANTSVLESSPVLRAAANARVVVRPAATANYAAISEVIHGCVSAVLAGAAPASAVEPSATGPPLAPATALDRGVRALETGRTGSAACPATGR